MVDSFLQHFNKTPSNRNSSVSDFGNANLLVANNSVVSMEG